MSKQADKSKICKAVDAFARRMKRQMLLAYDAGVEGWDDPASPYWRGGFEKDICDRIRRKLQTSFDNNAVDAANYLMMLAYLRSRRAKDKPNE